MSERSIIITEKDGAYQIDSSLVNEFELLGILEYIVFDLKNSKSERAKITGSEEKENPAGTVKAENVLAEKENPARQSEPAPETAGKLVQDNTQETSTNNSTAAIPPTPDLRTRIGNAVKAVRNLGGNVKDIDLGKLTEDELQTELEELTNQYKRLKISNGTK